MPSYFRARLFIFFRQCTRALAHTHTYIYIYIYSSYRPNIFAFGLFFFSPYMRVELQTWCFCSFHLSYMQLIICIVVPHHVVFHATPAFGYIIFASNALTWCLALTHILTDMCTLLLTTYMLWTSVTFSFQSWTVWYFKNRIRLSLYALHATHSLCLDYWSSV